MDQDQSIENRDQLRLEQTPPKKKDCMSRLKSRSRSRSPKKSPESRSERKQKSKKKQQPSDSQSSKSGFFSRFKSWSKSPPKSLKSDAQSKNSKKVDQFKDNHLNHHTYESKNSQIISDFGYEPKGSIRTPHADQRNVGTQQFQPIIEEVKDDAAPAEPSQHKKMFRNHKKQQIQILQNAIAEQDQNAEKGKKAKAETKKKASPPPPVHPKTKKKPAAKPKQVKKPDSDSQERVNTENGPANDKKIAPDIPKPPKDTTNALTNDARKGESKNPEANFARNKQEMQQKLILAEQDFGTSSKGISNDAPTAGISQGSPAPPTEEIVREYTPAAVTEKQIMHQGPMTQSPPKPEILINDVFDEHQRGRVLTTHGPDNGRAVRFQRDNNVFTEGSSDFQSAQVGNQMTRTPETLAKPKFGKCPPGAQSMTIQSEVSGVYMGGSARQEEEKSPKFNQSQAAHFQYLQEQQQNLDGSFDGPLRKPNTQIQQPNQGQNSLNLAPVASPINIPSQPASVNDPASPTFQPSLAKRKKKPLVPQKDLLEVHRNSYRANFIKAKTDYKTSKWDIEGIMEEMKAATIKCVKYNYSLDDGVQNFFQYDGLLNLSKDGKELILTLKKYEEKPIHVLEPDPHVVKKERDLHKRKVARNTILLKQSISRKMQKKAEDAERHKVMFEQAQPDKHSDHEIDFNESLTQDQKDDLELPDYKEEDEINRIKDRYKFTTSSTSCALTDIQGIIFGGFSSRFWIYRKHLCCLDYNFLMKDTKRKKFRDGKTELPFYAWQCITLDLNDRQVDLVIKDQKSMDLLIKFLVFSINTMDCRRNSAEKFVKGATLFEVKRRERQLRRMARQRGYWQRSDLELTQEQKDQIEYQWRKKIYQQTTFKYTLMRIRSKIAYQAFQNRVSINELIVQQIADSYEQLTTTGSIPLIADYSDQVLEQYEDILDGDVVSSTITKLMALNLDPKIRKRKQFLYIKKEMKGLGINSFEELEPQQRQFLENIIEKNTQPSEREDLVSQKVVERHRALAAKEHTHKDNGQKGGIAGNALFDKTKCCDVFNDVVVEDLQMYEQRSGRVKLQMKFKRMQMSAQLTKIKFMLGVGGLTDIFYLKAVLRKIELQKKMFVLELEQGQEVYIPNELSCDTYPQAFRFYDPIIQVVNNLFQSDNQVYHTLKTEFNLDKIKGSDWMKDLLIKIGVLDNPKKPQLYTKHQLINENNLNQIDHSQSHHALSLQKSRYLLVDSQEDRLVPLAQHQVFQSENREDFEKYMYSLLQEQGKSIEDKQLNLRFCHNDEVTQKRQKFIKFKQTFYQRHDHLKNNGQKFHTIKKLQTFIYDNLEHLYAIRPRDLSYGQNVLSKDLDLIPQHKLTGRQMNLLHKDKITYAEYLLNETEKKIMARRAHTRNCLVDTIYEECAPSIGYNQKNSYLEDRIEATNSYFNHMDDLNNKGAQMETWKKQLFKLNREIRRMEQEGLIQKIEPLAYIDKLIKEEQEALAKAAQKSPTDSDMFSPMSMEYAPPKQAGPQQTEEKMDDRTTEHATTVC